MPPRILAACVAILLAAACPARAQALAGPRELLATLPPETALTVLPIRGTLRAAPGVVRWRLYVNDSTVFESTFEPGKTETAVALGLILRRGDNLVAIESFSASNDQPIERWSTHVHRHLPAEARQYAILAQGQLGGRDVPSQILRLRQALVAHGLATDRIVIVSNLDALAAAIGRISLESTSRDQVLIYFAGMGRLSTRSGEPELLFAAQSAGTSSQVPGTSSWPVGNLIRQAADLASMSVLLDITYAPVAAPAANASAQTASVAQTASGTAPWLRTISDASVELAYTNPLFNGSDARGFTDDVIEQLAVTRSGSQCRTFASVAQAVASQNSQKPSAAWPLFHTRLAASSFRFCPTASARSPRLIIADGSPINATPPARFADISLPPSLRSPQVLVDGVPVVLSAARLGRTTTSVLAPIGPGLHAVDLVDLGGNAPALNGVIGRASQSPSTAKWSDALQADVQQTVPGVTSEAVVALPFVIGATTTDQAVRYEVRNNGVVITHDLVRGTAQLQRRQIVRRIPLNVGVNRIVVELTQGDQFASSRLMITRRVAQPVRALIVGVGSPAGALPLKGTGADVERMRDILLRYTDARPADLQILTGEAATRQAILGAIAASGLKSTAVPGETFVFYFSGYGLTIDEGRGEAVRCLVPGGFDPARARATCLSTADVDVALDAVGRALVIADTSYDGAAGPESRTYRNFTAADTAWRTTSGSDRPDRTLLVAGGSNTVAIESESGGLFTSALERAIRSQLQKPEATMRTELPLLEAYERTREDMSRETKNRQVPIMKGVLAAPFAFVSRSADDLKQEAAGIERAARSDFVSMRPVDFVRLERASDLYTKVLAMAPDDVDARLGRARVLVLRGDVKGAAAALAAAEPPMNQFARERAVWLSIRAGMSMRSGGIASAIADMEAAEAIDPADPTFRAQLGMLYIVAGNLQGARERLQPVLAEVQNALTDDEMGRVVIHTYLTLRRLGRTVDAILLLDSFTDTSGGRSLLLRPISAIQRIVPGLGSSPQVRRGVRAPWLQLVALYFRDRDRYESTLAAFRKDNEAYDVLDPSAFDCLLNFHVGMIESLDAKRQPEATAAFERVIAAGRTDYAEYWMAKAQIEGVK